MTGSSDSVVHPDHRIRLTEPARQWTEALPLGNGHLATMCFADPANDRFALNHDSLWSGSPRNERAGGVVSTDDAVAAVAEARRALAVGDRIGADSAVRRLQARYSQAFLPLGDLHLRRDNSPALLSRELDLTRAVHEAVAEDGTVRRSYISAPDGVLVIETHFPAPTETTITFSHQLHEVRRSATASMLEVWLRAPSDLAPGHEDVDPPMSWSEEAGDAVQAVVRVEVATDGLVEAPNGELVVTGARQLRVVLSCETTFTSLGEIPDGDIILVAQRAAQLVASALAMDPEKLVSRHEADHATLYSRFDLSLPAASPGQVESDPIGPNTATRLAGARATGAPMSADPALAALLVHYGRYLLIASSRPGSLPATLQGVWNEELCPPWSSNYTLNINTEMNYWGVETAALAECHEPLADLVASLSRNGAEVAASLYGARGWVAHHNSDAWAFASPVGMGTADPAWAFWPMAGAWLVRHLVERVRFTTASDRRTELIAQAWPTISGAVAFLRDWMIELSPGKWGSPLATSPENTFPAGTDGSHAAVTRHTAMDAELVHDVAAGALELLELADRAVLGSESETTAVAEEAAWLLEHVALPHIGPDGAIAEWYDDEVSLDQHHRHVSMLYGAYPGSRELSGEERGATSRSLDLRGDDSTGWSLVWKIALRARLRQGDRVGHLLELLARDATRSRGQHEGGLYPNLFAAHPPFQIDGNLGLVGAALECIVQSHRREAGTVVIDVLPAIPPAWRTGEVKGMRARSGLDICMAWSEGLVNQLVLTAAPDAPETSVIVRGGGLDTVVTIPAGRSATVGRDSVGRS